jgi:hypothetical protein
MEVLKRHGYPIEGLRSKDWLEFASADAPRMDFVFTVCDRAAAQTCPVWPGQPMTAHWSIPDPAAVEGDEVARMLAFRQAFRELEHRIAIFLSLPLTSLDRLKLQQQIDAIGQARRPVRTAPVSRAAAHPQAPAHSATVETWLPTTRHPTVPPAPETDSCPTDPTHSIPSPSSRR